MVEVVKQSMADVWASAGDVVMPDVAKIQQGWLVEVPPRQYWNWMQNRTDTNLSYIFQRGIPEWDDTVEYQNNKSFVVYNGVVYQSIQTGTNKQPDTQTTFWKKAFAQYTTALNAIGGVTPAADRYVYFTSTSAATTGTITAFGRSILDDVDAAAVRTTIDAQQADATLTALAGVSTAANKLPYFNGVDTATVTDLTAFGRSLIDDADATAARTTLGVYSIAQVDSIAAGKAFISSGIVQASNGIYVGNPSFGGAGDGSQRFGSYWMGTDYYMGPITTDGAAFQNGHLRWTRGSATLQLAGTLAATGFAGPLNGNATTATTATSATYATTLSGDQSNWANLRSSAVANMLGWKNYGNSHVIFDASAGTAPNGAAISNSNAGAAWSPALPTLMGWNGSTTYGVRVDSARVADACADTGWITLSLINGFSHGPSALQIRRVGNIVYLQGVLYRATPPASLTQFAIVPSGYRPAKSVAVMVPMNADNFNWLAADMNISSDGSATIGLTGLPSQNNAYWNINTSWVTDYA